VVDFVRQNGMTVIGGTRDGMDVQVRASVANIESTFHLTLRTYQHPTEDRTFYATDSEPVANLKVSLWHISGLDNYATPKPRFSKRSDAIARGVTAEEKIASNATTGSGPSASYLGSDMRAACYGGSNLTGAGQNAGLLEYYGTNLADLNTYLRNAGPTNSVPVTLLSVDGTSTVCNYSSSSSCDDTEQILDITRSWAWLLV
jgi:kumamolisin